MARIEDIRNRVRAIINEYVQVDDDFSIESNTIIDELIDQAAKEVVAVAPSYYCYTSTALSKNTVVRPDGRRVVLFTVTDDMLKPVQVSSPYLMKPVLEFLPTTDASYPAQYSSSKGVGAGSAKPVAYISGATDIEVHSIPGDIDEKSIAASLIYVPIPHACNGELRVMTAILPAVCTRTAQLVLEAENSPSSALVGQRYKEIISEWQEG